MDECRVISWERLLSHIDGGADPELQLHLDRGCVSCRLRLRQLTTILAAFPEATRPPDAPSERAIAYAQGLARLLNPPSAPGGFRRYIAQLLPRQSALLAAHQRGAPGQQRTFETDQHILTLWEEPEDPPYRYLIGQVYNRSGIALAPVSVTLWQGAQAERTATYDATEFHLDRLMPGTYVLCCRFPDEEIVVPQLEVGSA